MMTNKDINDELADLIGLVADYADDLNLLNSCWKKLTPDQKRIYRENLREIVFQESLGMQYVPLSEIENDVYGICENASARTRARAMIATLSLPKTFIPHEECISAGNPNRRFLRCENCNKVVDVNEDSHHEGCDFVYGRRGWRQLGAYDG